MLRGIFSTGVLIAGVSLTYLVPDWRLFILFVTIGIVGVLTARDWFNFDLDEWGDWWD